MSEIAIIGAGAWGTALSIALGRKATHRVRLWAHEKEVRDSIVAQRTNELYLPGQTIPECVVPTNDYKEALHGAEIVVSVMPSHHCRAVFEELHVHLTPTMMVVTATKGLEGGTMMRMSEVISRSYRLAQVSLHRLARSAVLRLPRKSRAVIRPRSPLLPNIPHWRRPSNASLAMRNSAFTRTRMSSA